MVDNLLYADPCLVLADYTAYVTRQKDVNVAWRDSRRWTRRSILNTAYAGKFSFDRTIAEYAQ
ncbi:Maltodextrin phosphorylase [Caballeronia arationis]|nr:Maltodextrin phosphorylase [Caballeronia arationis]